MCVCVRACMCMCVDGGKDCFPGACVLNGRGLISPASFPRYLKINRPYCEYFSGRLLYSGPFPLMMIS